MLFLVSFFSKSWTPCGCRAVNQADIRIAQHVLADSQEPREGFADSQALEGFASLKKAEVLFGFLGILH